MTTTIFVKKVEYSFKYIHEISFRHEVMQPTKIYIVTGTEKQIENRYMALLEQRSDSLPPPIVIVCLQLPANRRRDPMRQPHIPQQPVVSLLVEDQLAVPAEARVYLAMTIEVRCEVPGAVAVVEIEDGAFADVDKETDVLAASVESS